MSLGFFLSSALIASALAPQPLSQLPADLKPLLATLQRHGFTVHIALPPVRESYGLFHSKTRTLWISPLTFPLGIARQTFLHEATHAAQSCPSGRLTSLGWKLNVDPVVESAISFKLLKGYHHGNHTLEREAFFVQGQSDAVTRLVRSLDERCE